MEENKVYIVPDIHCRSFYKPVLEVKDHPVVMLGDFMDPYRFEDEVSDEQGLENLKEIIDYARNNSNVVLLVGNHDASFVWSYLGWERTAHKYYDELHKLYRDNIDLFKPIHRINDTLFTHAGICNGWINIMNRAGYQLTEDNIEEFINSEFQKELENETAANKDWLWPSLKSPIFDVGRSRGGRAPYGGPFWADYYGDFYKPAGWQTYQIFSHTLTEVVGVIRPEIGGVCIDSRAIFEYNPKTHFIKPSEINTEETKKQIINHSWKGYTIKIS